MAFLPQHKFLSKKQSEHIQFFPSPIPYSPYTNWAITLLIYTASLYFTAHSPRFIGFLQNFSIIINNSKLLRAAVNNKYSILPEQVLNSSQLVDASADYHGSQNGCICHFIRKALTFWTDWLLITKTRLTPVSGACNSTLHTPLCSNFFLCICQALQPVVSLITFLQSHIPFGIFQSSSTRILLWNSTVSFAILFLICYRKLGLINYLATSIWFINSSANSSIWKRLPDEFFFKECTSTGNCHFFTMSNRCK